MSLHIVNKSPFERNSLDSCLRLATKGSPIILIEDAVYAAKAGTAVADKISSRTGDFSFYVLGPDLAARGIDEENVMEGVKVVGYDDFVDLTVDNGTPVSWL